MQTLCNGFFENIVQTLCNGFFENIVQTVLSVLFWDTLSLIIFENIVQTVLSGLFLTPLMSPRQSSYVDPATQPAPRQYALLRYVLSNSLYNTYPEMSHISIYGWDNDKWLWTVSRLVPPKVFEMVWWNGLVKSIWNGLVKSIWNGLVKGLVKPFYIFFNVEVGLSQYLNTI